MRKRSAQVARNILVALVLNVGFAVLELLGGIMTNSVAILSDAVHDFGDAISIAISYVLEKKSQKRPDARHTFGYARYSVLGAMITTLVLVVGSTLIIVGATQRLFAPEPVNYDGMIALAVFGVVVNGIAAYMTCHGESLNQRSVNLHMLDDVLGWVVVLIGAIIMHYTQFWLIDPLMSLAVAIFILVEALKNIRGILNLFLEKTPENMSVAEIKRGLKELPGVEGVHHLHLWSMDGEKHYATMHIVTTAAEPEALKVAIREEMKMHGVGHTTIEIEQNQSNDGGSSTTE